MSRDILQSVINNFDLQRFRRFFSEKNKKFRPSEDNLDYYCDDNFSNGRKLGELSLNDGNLLICAFKVKRELSERSGKKVQYNLGRGILKDNNFQQFNAGIFVFYDQNENFRFSLIYDIPKGIHRDWSVFRRFTFFVSQELTYKTFLQRIGDGDFSSLEKIKDAFSVEKVNKEFYNHIANFFYMLVGGQFKSVSRILNYDGILKLPNNDSENEKKEFSVRLIGRIIFCWFLKFKKSDNNIPLVPESILSKKAVLNNNSYFHNILEKLFFEILNTPLIERKVKNLLESNTIPFLNGGLFEPHTEDYYSEFYKSKLVIPDKWFEEFFGILEQYNFTIDENSIADSDVSVDPEMIGRIFENLLAEINPETGETAKKSTGSYYTPREIVDFMVDQSLKQYLSLQTNISYDILDQLLSYHDISFNLNENEQNLIIDALDKLKIIDPACGSGAFPMGILQKLLLILQKVDPDSKKWKDKMLNKIENVVARNEFLEKTKNENWDYIHKLGIIQYSIYGVDIQSIAVEISKLRFFLSLVVDEKIKDVETNRGIKPLPNLEFKFIAANSLISIPSIYEQQMLTTSQEEISNLKKLREDYLNSYGIEKKNIELRFKETQKNIYNENNYWLKDDSTAMRLSNWNPFSNEPSDWFDPEWMFGVKEGFDIVIANPPYVRQEKFTQIKEALKKHYGEFFNGRADLYTFFIKLGFNLTKENGIFAYITSNKFFVRGYGKNTRSLLTKDVSLKKVVNFGELPVFQASVDSAILIAKNTKPKEEESLDFAQAKLVSDIRNITQFFEANKGTIKLNTLGEGVWSLQDSTKLAVLNKIKNHKNTLGSYCNKNIFAGIKTGYDEAFVIDEATKRDLIKKDPKCAQLIKPWLRGKDVRKWQTSYKNLYVIYIPLHKLSIDDYPTIKEYLSKFKSKLQERATNQEWYEMQQPQEKFTELFDRPKIIYPDCAKEMRTLYDESGAYGTMAMYFIPYDPVIMGILNSKLFDWYARMTFATFGDPWNGGRIIFKTIYMSKVPIPDTKNNTGTLIKECVDKILAITKTSNYLENPEKKAEVKEYESQIDQMVYKLYGLTPEEIEIVENSSK